jgi:DNA invertase Pin-like site-specific DNA recombinase
LRQCRFTPQTDRIAQDAETVDAVRAILDQGEYRRGVPPQQIAEEVGKSAATVQRHITKAIGPRPKGRPKKSN